MWQHGTPNRQILLDGGHSSDYWRSEEPVGVPYYRPTGVYTNVQQSVFIFKTVCMGGGLFASLIRKQLSLLNVGRTYSLRNEILGNPTDNKKKRPVINADDKSVNERSLSPKHRLALGSPGRDRKCIVCNVDLLRYTNARERQRRRLQHSGTFNSREIAYKRVGLFLFLRPNANGERTFLPDGSNFPMKLCRRPIHNG